jgi:hypothetical protein
MTTLLTPCDLTAVDELGHVYQFQGPYTLECEDWVKFNYTDLIEVWSNDHCCSYTDADSGWGDDNVDTVSRIQKGRNHKEAGFGCGCKN